eukprot:Clim_evm9s32 gene=Clim_evmTU9s32
MSPQGWLLAAYSALLGISAAVVLATSVDWIIHRNVKSKGWQLHRVIFTTSVLIMLKEFWTVVYIQTASEGVFFVWLFFVNIAEGMLILLMMLFASGWCITRDTLGEHTLAIYIGPALYVISGLTKDYIIGIEDDKDENGILYLSSTLERNILFIAGLTNLFMLFYMWTWIFQTSQLEREALEMKIIRTEQQAAGANGNVEGLQSDGDPEAILENAYNEDSPSHEQTDAHEDIDEEDEDKENTVPDKAKLRLMVQFNVAVTFYFLSLILLLMWTIWKAQSSAFLAVSTDLLKVCLLGALAYHFRLTDNNPYFMLADYQTGIELEDNEVDTVDA